MSPTKWHGNYHPCVLDFWSNCSQLKNWEKNGVNKKKLGSIVKHVAPIIRATTLPNARVGNITNWDEWNVIALILINNCLNNSVVSHVQPKNTLQEAWQRLKRLFESQDAITKKIIKKILCKLWKW